MKTIRINPEFIRTMANLSSRIEKSIGVRLNNIQLQKVISIKMKGFDVKVEKKGKRVIISGVI